MTTSNLKYKGNETNHKKAIKLRLKLCTEVFKMMEFITNDLFIYLFFYFFMDLRRDLILNFTLTKTLMTLYWIFSFSCFGDSSQVPLLF